MATGPNFAPPLPLMQPPACRLLDPPNSPPIDPFLADRLRNHRHLAIAPRNRGRQRRLSYSARPVFDWFKNDLAASDVAMPNHVNFRLSISDWPTAAPSPSAWLTITKSFVKAV